MWLCFSCAMLDDRDYGKLYAVPYKPDATCAACYRLPSQHCILAAIGRALACTAQVALSPPAVPTRPTLTAQEAATLLGTTLNGLYALVARGKLPRSIGPGRRLLFERESLLEFLNRRASSSERNRR